VTEVSDILELFRKALETELSTEVGRIDLAFGVIAASAVALLYADDLVTRIGDWILLLLKRKPAPDRPGHKLAAVICMLVYFAISLLICSARIK